jgi:nicotinamidase-related amidase
MTRTVEVPPYPIEQSVTVPAITTALIVVDMQNDFVTPGGSLVVPDAAGTVPVIKGLLERAHASGAKVFYTQDTHDPGDPEFQIWGEHVMKGTWGWQVVDALAPRDGDRVVTKLRYDGFFCTSLDHELRLGAVKTAVVCGTAANVCVLHTVGTAALHGYRIVVPIDAISALTPFDLEASLRQIHFLYHGILTTALGVTWER